MLNETGIKQLVQRMELDAHRRPEAADEAAADARPRGDAVLRARREGPLGAPDRSRRRRHVAERSDAFLVPDISEEIHRIDKDPELSPHERIERAPRRSRSEYAVKSEKLHIIHKLLQAHVLYEKDVDYLVQDDQVMIVDEFTGRIMTGRRWSDGLHQAVEAKEGVQVKGETQTFATITIQNYFRMYDKLAGMTGTAETEETEFYQIYGLEVARHSDAPADDPRSTRQDRIYKTRREKYNAMIDEVERLHGLGLADPDRHGDRGRVGDAVAAAQAAGAQARSAEREVSPARGGNRGRRGAEGCDHDRDQHGRPRHRHQTGQGPRVKI